MRPQLDAVMDADVLEIGTDAGTINGTDNGEGVPQNYASWILKAAEQGLDRAQLNLGLSASRYH